MSEEDYELGQVGRQRHPELYSEPIRGFYETVEEELALWLLAEEMERDMRVLGVHQLFLIFHLICALRGLNRLEEAGWYDWMKGCIGV